jgi:hypothetical protein
MARRKDCSDWKRCERGFLSSKKLCRKKLLKKGFLESFFGILLDAKSGALCKDLTEIF